MTLVSEKLLQHYTVYWSKHLDKSRQMEVDYHGRRCTSSSCGEMALNRQTFIVGYLQFLEGKHLHTAWSFEIGKKMIRQLSMSSSPTVLQNGSPRPSEISPRDGGEV